MKNLLPVQLLGAVAEFAAAEYVAAELVVVFRLASSLGSDASCSESSVLVRAPSCLPYSFAVAAAVGWVGFELVLDRDLDSSCGWAVAAGCVDPPDFVGHFAVARCFVVGFVAALAAPVDLLVGLLLAEFGFAIN